MCARRGKGRLFLGALVGATIGAVLVSAIFAGIGAAARTAKPENDKRPTISGTAQEGKTLTGDRGTWKNNPTDFDYSWTRCNKTGDNCSDIKGAHALTYVRREWENTADPVSPDVVRQVRAETSSRTQAWTADELHKVR